MANVYIDPSRPVEKAVITHGHSDHSRRGSNHYLCSANSVPILRHRLGAKRSIQGVAYGKSVRINGVQFSFHPAGHIVGSAQVRVHYKGETWVVTGDYKLENDGLCAPYEPVRCNHFVTESTFALPVYRWTPQEQITQDILEWWHFNRSIGITSIICAYSLGKAQRLIHHLKDGGPIYAHHTVQNMNEVLRTSGINIPETIRMTDQTTKEDLKGALIIAPSSAVNTGVIGAIEHKSISFASGWMAIRKNRKNRSFDHGFALSDHVDWNGVLDAIKYSKAQHIYVTHGYTQTLTTWLNEQGFIARAV